MKVLPKLLVWLTVFNYSFNNASSITPLNFKLPTSVSGTAVFVDFKKADYFITYDLDKKTATYRAIISFEQNTHGKPIFDVVAKPKSVMINNDFVIDHEVATPQKETMVRVIDQELPPGQHLLSIQGQITNLVKFGSNGVSAAHWTSDLTDRSYLENYLPTNLEYDQYSMTYHINIIGTDKAHRLYANGKVIDLKDGLTFLLQYPDYYTASSGYFHLAPANFFKEINFEFKSISGKNIPVLIYGKAEETNFQEFTDETLKVLNELERDYGSYPHNSVVIFNNGRGGMEYCGATMTEFWALAHELTHSYFARGLMPANGNAGWIDEAIASWRDNNYPRINNFEGSSNLSAHEPYTRKTDMLAYSFGAGFISYIDYKISSNLDVKGMKSFLKHARNNYLFKPYTVEMFNDWMNEYFDFNFTHDFRLYTYTTVPPITPVDPTRTTPERPRRTWGKVNPIHQKLGLSELFNFL